MTLPSGLPECVGDEEDVARFLTSSGHYNSSAVRPAAFMPNPRNGETSVFRHGAEPLDELKAIAQVEATLEVRAGEPPPLHADIVGWPWQEDDPAFGKAAQKELAALIAQKAGAPLRF